MNIAQSQAVPKAGVIKSEAGSRRGVVGLVPHIIYGGRFIVVPSP